MNNNRKLTMLLTFALSIVIIFSNFGLIKAYGASDLNGDLKESLISIETTKSEDYMEDLKPLKEVLKDKKVIGIGESTLGSKEFVEIKHRLAQFLVEEMDFRLFAIDAEFADVKVVNDYILNGNGSKDDVLWALRHFIWSTSKVEGDISIIEPYAYLASWTTREMWDMIEWMKTYNHNALDDAKIKFYGIDMELPENSIDDLFEYLYIVDAGAGSKYSRRLSDLVSIHGFNFKHPQHRPIGLFSGMMEELSKEFKANKQQYINASSETEYIIANQDLNSILQWIDYRGTNLNSGANEALSRRSYHMAENIKWILDFEEQFHNQQIVILSHNSHISKKVNNYKSLGEHLNNIYEDKYYAIGLDFYEGRFRAFPVNLWGTPISHYLAKFNINSSSKNTLAYNLEKTGLPISFLDFNTASKNENILKLLSKEQSIHNIGIMYPGKYVPSKYVPELSNPFSNVVPLEAYNGFLFVKTISETTGVYDLRDTRVEDGDNELVSHYLHIVFGQIYFLIGVIIVVLLIILFVRRKIKVKKSGRGARYPNSSRWD